MTTRQMILDLGRCLRASTPPLLTLGVLILARTANAESPMSAALDGLFLVAWRAAMVGTLLWFLSAVLWAVARPRRDRHAFQQLQRLRDSATSQGRVLVHVQTTVWSSPAGQHVVVANVATGTFARVWLPETTVTIGAFVVLERTNGGVSVVEWMNAHQVEAGHRHERRLAVRQDISGQASVDLLEDVARDAALQLIEETERFLIECESRQ